MAGKRILLIGGFGYIGSRLLVELDRVGHRCAVCDFAEMPERLIGVPSSVEPGVFFHDYSQINHSGAWRWHYDLVIFVAGHSSVRACMEDRLGSLRNNLFDLVTMVHRHIAETDIGFIYASSASVYSGVGGPEAKFANLYDYEKYAADGAIQLLHPKSWGLRFGTVCGPSPNIRTDLMLNSMVRSALSKGSVKLGNPNIRRPILDIEDLCAGVLKIVEGGVQPGLHRMASFNSTPGELALLVSTMLGTPGNPLSIEDMPPTPAYDFTMGCEDWLEPRGTAESIISDLVSEYGNEWSRERE